MSVPSDLSEGRKNLAAKDNLVGNPEPANIQEFNARDVPQKIIETLNAVVQDHLEIEITSAEAKQEPDAQADRPGGFLSKKSALDLDDNKNSMSLPSDPIEGPGRNTLIAKEKLVEKSLQANIQDFNPSDLPQIIETLNEVVQVDHEIENTVAEGKQEPDVQADRSGELIILNDLSFFIKALFFSHCI